MTEIPPIELVFRGMASGVNLLAAGLFLFSSASLTQRLLGAGFALAIAVYAVISAAHTATIFGPIVLHLRIFAVYAPVLFWWFTLALFDDDFQWDWWKLAPGFIYFALHPPYFLHGGALDYSPVQSLLHMIIQISLMAHVLWIALGDRANDLVDPRRRFRLYFAVIVATAMITVALGEVFYDFGLLPAQITLLHAVMLATVSLSFGLWMLMVNPAFFAATVPAGGRGGGTVTTSPAVPEHRADLQKLSALMDDGVYREDGLTVARLADKVGVPEHQLRKLINQELGFRNFSSFLNERRIAEAKRRLADPAESRTQVLRIALDLGYGSIAPFNRAFKLATGATPTDFRRENLGKSVIDSEKSASVSK